MKKKIVFMLQNGIGFGHFKLALNISKYLKEVGMQYTAQDVAGKVQTYE